MRPSVLFKKQSHFSRGIHWSHWTSFIFIIITFGKKSLEITENYNIDLFQSNSVKLFQYLVYDQIFSFTGRSEVKHLWGNCLWLWASVVV